MEQDNSSKSDILSHLQLLKQLNKQVDFQNKKINELKVNYCYKVISFKNIDTKFGKRCIVTLLDTFENNKFDTFLPEKYDDIPTNSNVNNIQLIYEGMNLATNGNRYHKIIFQ